MRHQGPVQAKIYGKAAKPVGIAPAVILVNPRYPHNVGAALRAASCFGVPQVWWTGSRVNLDDAERLPREERMKGYRDVNVFQFDQPFDTFRNVVPVAIELLPSSQSLLTFQHPDNAVYVFGPEDGSIPSVVRRHCHEFVTIPSRRCTNLAAAVYLILYDRMRKRVEGGLEEVPVLSEDRAGWSTENESGP